MKDEWVYTMLTLIENRGGRRGHFLMFRERAVGIPLFHEHNECSSDRKSGVPAPPPMEGKHTTPHVFLIQNSSLFLY